MGHRRTQRYTRISADALDLRGESGTAELQKSSRKIRVDNRQFVWPYGDYNQSLIGLTQVGLPSAPLYKSARNVEFDDNAYGTFPYALKILELRNTTQIGEVQSWIDDLKAGGRWGILAMHDVVNNPGTYAISPTMLDQVAQRVASSGVSVVNYRTGYQTFANIPAP